MRLPMDEESQALWTVRQAAAYLQVPASWVYQRTRKNAIPLRRLGRHCRIPRQELMEWVDRQTDLARSGNSTIKTDGESSMS